MAAESTELELELYIAGNSMRSRHALANLERLCDLHLPGRYRLHVVDVVADPARAELDSIMATPTLIKRKPLPELRLVGDMSDEQAVVAALNLPDPAP